MNSEHPPRVRVSGPPRVRRVRPVDRVGDVHEQTELGGVYLRSLLRAQLALAGRVVLALVVLLGSLPLAFYLRPGLADAEVFGVPAAWLVLGVLTYPLLVFLGWRYVHRVERNERDFTAIVEAHE